VTERDPSDVEAYARELDEITIGGAQPLTAPIEIREYDPEWPELYAREEERIRSILGERVVRIEHAGSTSVPGLPAKPIVDIVLEVTDSADEESYARDLEAAGYPLRIREPDWFEHRLFKGPDTNVNLHVFSAGCEGGQADASVPRPSSCKRRRPGALRGGQARARFPRLDLRAAVRGREDRGRPRDPRPRRLRTHGM
jgi:GrpB-like predicted nucleotidyltransferase (UPF0157 family)